MQKMMALMNERGFEKNEKKQRQKTYFGNKLLRVMRKSENIICCNESF